VTLAPIWVRRGQSRKQKKSCNATVGAGGNFRAGTQVSVSFPVVSSSGVIARAANAAQDYALEPTSALDPEMVREVLDVMRSRWLAQA